MNLIRWVGYLALLCVGLMAAGPAMAGNATGTITAIDGKSATVQVSGAGGVKVGDTASIGFEVEGVGLIALTGTWTVTSVSGAEVRVEPAGGDAQQPRVGQKVTFTATAPAPATVAAPAPDPATAPRGKGSSTIPFAIPPVTAETDVSGAGRMPSELSPQGDPLVSKDGVKEIQRRLNALGYDAGPVDGDWGIRSFAAIRAFQQDMGLPPHGLPVETVLRALQRQQPAQQSGPYAGLDDQALSTMADAYYNGTRGRPRDYTRAKDIYAELDRRGDTEGTYNLGVCYALGHGTARDMAEGRRLFEKAAAKNHGRALYNLAVMSLKGLAGLPKDNSRALAYMQRAATADLVEAWHGMAEFYNDGIGVTASRNQAIAWYRRAARSGFAKSQEALTKMGASW